MSGGKATHLMFGNLFAFLKSRHPAYVSKAGEQGAQQKEFIANSGNFTAYGNRSISSPSNLVPVASSVTGGTVFQDKQTGAQVNLMPIGTSSSGGTIYFNPATKTQITIPSGTSGSNPNSYSGRSGATGIVEPNVGAATGQSTQNIRLGSGPASAINLGAVQTVQQGQNFNLVSQRVGGETNYAIVNKQTGRVVGVPGTESAKGRELRSRLLALSEKTGQLSSGTVYQNAKQAGLPYAGSGFSEDLFAASINDDYIQKSAQTIKTENAPANNQPYINGPYADKRAVTVVTKQQLIPTGPVSRDLNPKELEAKRFYESKNPVERAALALNTIISSPRGFEIAGKSLVNSGDQQNILYGEIAKQKFERERTGETNPVVLAGKETFKAFTTAETPAREALTGAAVGYGFGAAGTLAGPFFSMGEIGGAVAKAAAANPKGIALTGAVLNTGFVAVTGSQSYKEAKEAGAGEQAAREAGASTAARSITFITGTKLGSALYAKQPSPFTGANVQVPVGSVEQEVTVGGVKQIVKQPINERVFTGVTYTTRAGEAIPLVGKSESKFVFGSFGQTSSPSLSKFSGSGASMVLETPAQTSYFGNPKTLAAMGASELEAQKLGGLYVARSTQRTASAFMEKLPEETQTAGKDVKLALSELNKQGTKYDLYGSYAAQTQTPKDLKNFVPADLDIRLKTTSPEQAEKVAKGLTESLNKKGSGEFFYSVSAEKPTLIESTPKLGGASRHAFDIHYAGEPLDPSLGAQPSGSQILGMNINQPTLKIEGQNVQRLSEQGVRKVGSTLTLRSEGGKISFAPESHRAKDIVDAYSVQTALLRSQASRGINTAQNEKYLENYVSAFKQTGQLTEEAAQARGFTLQLGSSGKTLTTPTTGATFASVGSTFSGQTKTAFSVGSTRSPSSGSSKTPDYFTMKGSTSKASTYARSPSSPASLGSPKVSPPSGPSAYTYSSPPSPPSPKPPSPPSPSPSSPSSLYGSSTYSSSKSSSSTYSSASTYGYSSFSLQSQKFGGGGGGSPQGGYGFTRPKVLPSKGSRSQTGVRPDLFSVSQTQRRTGFTQYGTPSTKAIKSSTLYKRSGGFLAPTQEQLSRKKKGKFGF